MDSQRCCQCALAAIYIYCYVCQMNVLKVHSEFRVRPTRPQVYQWLRSTTAAATTIYLAIGFAGFFISHQTGQVTPNILVDLLNSKHPRKSDTVVVEVARYCMVVTLVLAMPMLVLPLRDILISILVSWTSVVHLVNEESVANQEHRGRFQSQTSDLALCLEDDGRSSSDSIKDQLHEHLLARSSSKDKTTPSFESGIEEGVHNISESSIEQSSDILTSQDSEQESGTSPTSAPLWLRFLVAMVLVGSAIGTAHFISSIDIVWDVLGSSMSILIALIIPTTSIIKVLSNHVEIASSEHSPATSHGRQRFKWIALLTIALPVMILSTANAIEELLLKQRFM